MTELLKQIRSARMGWRPCGDVGKDVGKDEARKTWDVVSETIGPLTRKHTEHRKNLLTCFYL